MGRTLGNELMGRYAIPFEVAGLLLTAALVGSIALASQEDERVEAGTGSGRIGRRPGLRRRHRAVVDGSVVPPPAPVAEAQRR